MRPSFSFLLFLLISNIALAADYSNYFGRKVDKRAVKLAHGYGTELGFANIDLVLKCDSGLKKIQEINPELVEFTPRKNCEISFIYQSPFDPEPIFAIFGQHGIEFKTKKISSESFSVTANLDEINHIDPINFMQWITKEFPQIIEDSDIATIAIPSIKILKGIFGKEFERKPEIKQIRILTFVPNIENIIFIFTAAIFNENGPISIDTIQVTYNPNTDEIIQCIKEAPMH